jgi:6-hydroxycyclohex-1-ene-1-carbonyl-CoA dehydrogenase
LPLTLGHEISGTVVAAGEGAERWRGLSVVVPAVIPCGVCRACRSGRGSICSKQVFPGNDVHGGFATHVRVPAHGLCEVPDLASRASNPHGLELWMLSVIADAVSTPYQAILRADVKDGDLAVFVGAGGVGGFGVQIAAALGAKVVAVDVDPERLALAGEHGAALTLRADQLDAKELRKHVKELAAASGTPSWRHRIFETSGTPQGQATAFGLLEPGAFLSVVGYTPQRVELRLSNLMAFDATAQGNWGCLPEHYPAVLAMVLAGKVALRPFVERRALSAINAAFSDIHARKTKRRVVLTPSS